MNGQIGRLAGYRADIVLLDLTRPDYMPLNDVLLQLASPKVERPWTR